MTRPPYVIAHYADNAGCGTHRIMRPVELMSKLGVINGRCDMNIWPDDQLRGVDPDIVVFQRQHEEVQIQSIHRYRDTLPNAFIVYELDDILSAVPEWSVHASFIPHDVDDRMRRAIEPCHAVSVSTKTLAGHIKAVCGDDVDVRIVPNMIGRDDIASVAEIRKNTTLPHGKPRIGWGGSISHDADLDLLLPAIEALHDKVQFVFVGMKPKTDVPVEFHEGVPPREFLQKMASLNLDLVLAPLVDHKFNHCKSNLRLIEAAACGYPVIASRITPYIEANPPVVAYAEDNEWLLKIERWLKNPDRNAAQKLNEWFSRRFIFDDKVEERLRGWLPVNAKVFRPKARTGPTDDIIVVSPSLSATPPEYRVVKKFEDVGDANADILDVRMVTTINKSQVERMKKRLVSSRVAAVCSFSNDGGLASFPRLNGFTPIDSEQGTQIDACAEKLFGNLTMEIPFAAGPAILVSRKVVDILGLPTDHAVEQAEGGIIEWGVAATAHGFTNVVAADVYVPALIQVVFEQFKTILNRIHYRWPPIQTPPDPLREARAHLEMHYHQDNYKTPPLTSPNDYLEWSKFSDEPGSKDLAFFAEHAEETTATFKTGWRLISGYDTKLAPHAEYMFADTIRKNPDAVLIYADHDFINEKGERGNHDFKPAILDYHMLLSRDYVSQIFAIRDDVRPEFFDNWYDAILQVVDTHGRDKVVHIPLCLAHLKEPTTEETIAKCAGNVAAATKHLSSIGRNAIVHQNPVYKQYGITEYRVDGEPLVSIIIITGGRVEMLSPCVGTLMTFTDYKNYELIIVTDKDVPKGCQDYLDTLKDNDKVKVFNWPHPYNWSAKNNFGVKQAKGDYFLFLNDDTRFAEKTWLTSMVGAAQFPDVGTVGGRLVYPNGTIQHVGVVCHEGLTGHIHKTMPEINAGYNGLIIKDNAATANTGACMLVSRKLYDEVGGLDEELAHNFNDVAFCLEMNRRGYHHVVSARASVQHLEGVTRISPVTDEGMKIQLAEGRILGAKYPDKEKYWNWNFHFAHVGGGLFVSGLNYDTLKWPKNSWPWRGEDWLHDVVLVIGENVDVLPDIQNGDIIYYSKCYGYNIKLERPALENLPPFDVRDLARARAMLAGIGISKIILGTIFGGVVETLRFLLKMGVPVEYRPINGEAICPRLDFRSNGASCDDGWRRGMCGACLDEHQSPFGEPNIGGWREDWRTFINASDLDLSQADTQTANAIKEVYRP